MDENELSLPPQLESALVKFYEAPQPAPAFASRLELDLRRRQIQSRQYSGSRHSPFRVKLGSAIQALRARPAVAILVALLALLLLTGVAYAVSRLAGYIPGFGFTTDAQAVYLLDGPVEISEGGITLQVEKAVSDRSQFWVELTAQGLPQGPNFSQAFIVYPDGQRIQFQMSGGTGLDNGETRLTYSFPPLTGDLQRLTLLIENLGGQNFNLPLELHRLRPGEMIPAQPADTGPLPSDSHDGLTLELENVAVTSDKTVLQVGLRFDQPGASLNTDWNVILTDQDGNLYPLRDISPDVPNWAVVPVQPIIGDQTLTEVAPSVSSSSTKLYETVPFNGGERLTLTLVAFPDAENLPMSVDFSTSALGFTFDLGSNPQVGQTWVLDKTLQVGHYAIHAIGAKMLSPTELSFEFAPISDITGLMLYSPSASGAAGGVPVQSTDNFAAGLSFEKTPTRPFEVRVTRVYYTAHGTWQIQWQPPVPSANDGGTPTFIAAPTAIAYPTATPAAPDSIQLEVQELARKFDAPLQQGPGWVHIVSETITNPSDAGQSYPPPYMKTEQWYEIDQEGFVTRSLWVDRDADEKVIQMSASVGNYSINFTTGDSGFNDSVRYRVSTDGESGFMEKTDSNVITREETVCDDGRPCLLITGSESFSPMQNPGETEAFYGTGRRVWIKLQTGEQVKTEVFWRLQGGAERVDFTRRVLVVEKVEIPPQEILDVLARVVVPGR